jgi:hypothetical protein
MKPTNIKRLQQQSRRLRVRRVDRNTYAVDSLSNPLANHIVTVYFSQNDVVHARCTCPWALNHGVACSHVMAALDFLASRKGRTLSFWSSSEEARRQKQRVFFLEGENRLDGSPEGVWITSRSAA